MNDREAIIAVFKAVGVLTERLTGERLIVDVETDVGMERIVSDGQHLEEHRAVAAAKLSAHR